MHNEKTSFLISIYLYSFVFLYVYGCWASVFMKTKQNFDKTTMRSFAIIPDIVAIDIYTKYGIDVHADDFIKHPAAVNKLKRIIKQEYPKLLTGGISNRFKYFFR